MPSISTDEQKKAAPLNFPKLESLRRLCREIQQYHAASVNYFKHNVGFQHVLGGTKKISVSSSATCVLSLVATNNWNANEADTKALLKYLLSKDTSAGLPPDNPFTAAWILEAVTALESYSGPLDEADLKHVTKKEEILASEIRLGGGAVSISKYPGSAYLTQLVVRVLHRRKKLDAELEKMVHDWVWDELTRQLALVPAKSKTQDAFAFAYLVMLATAVTPLSKISPERTSIQRAALQTVFDSQLKDGTWPLSRPLFHYPNFGNAHCYEYEMLTQLLQEPELEDLLLENLLNVSLAAESLESRVYRLEQGVWAWASGHHPQLEGPESWTTASVYHFIHRLDRLLAEAVRRELFSYAEAPLPRIVAPEQREREDFAPHPDFLDSKIDVPGSPGSSLREFLWEKFVKPLFDEAAKVLAGGEFDKATPRSAIFFGPPGTSKTNLSRKIADFLGWPLLEIDPSLFLRNGMDGIQAEANMIFRMLEETERIVVLFDEFDELVRERGSSDSQPFSRLLTTAMLPKLANIHKRGTLVFIIATNNIAEFDLAIGRPGRFDRVVQIMPPTYDEKIRKDWGPAKINLGEKLQSLDLRATPKIVKQIEQLTFDECDTFVAALAQIVTREAAISALADHWSHCTLQQPVSKKDKTKWITRCKREAKQFHR